VLQFVFSHLLYYMEYFTLYVCNIPKGYGLFNVQQLIEKILDDADGLHSIRLLKEEGKRSPLSTVQIQLKTQECMSLDELLWGFKQYRVCVY